MNRTTASLETPATEWDLSTIPDFHNYVRNGMLIAVSEILWFLGHDVSKDILQANEVTTWQGIPFEPAQVAVLQYICYTELRKRFVESQMRLREHGKDSIVLSVRGIGLGKLTSAALAHILAFIDSRVPVKIERESVRISDVVLKLESLY